MKLQRLKEELNRPVHTMHDYHTHTQRQRPQPQHNKNSEDHPSANHKTHNTKQQITKIGTETEAETANERLLEERHQQQEQSQQLMLEPQQHHQRHHQWLIALQMEQSLAKNFNYSAAQSDELSAVGRATVGAYEPMVNNDRIIEVNANVDDSSGSSGSSKVQMPLEMELQNAE